MTNWFSNIFSGNKTTEADIQRGAGYPHVRAAQPQAEAYRDQYQQPAFPQYQQPYAYAQPQLVEVTRPEASRPSAPPPEVKVDVAKEVRKAVAEIRKVKREYWMDDVRWRAQAKEFMAQERTEEAEDLINSLIDSKLFQRQLDRNIIMVEKAARTARTHGAINKVYSLIDRVVKAANQGEQVDIQQITEDQIDQQTRLTEITDQQQMASRMALDNEGRQFNKERETIRTSIIDELRREMTGGMPTPAVTQLQNAQPAQPANQALLAQLS